MAIKTDLKIVVMAIGAVLISTGSAFSFSGGGLGTYDEPFVITDVYQLQEMQGEPGAYYVLGNDIDAYDTENWNGGEGFVPVTTFTGTFDGQNYAINNLYINRDDTRQGLFGQLYRAEIKNVHMVNGDVSFDTFGGILAGYANKNSFVHHCSATGTVTVKPGSADSRGGGLIGCVGYGSQIDQCFSGVNVNADRRRQVGGLVGYLRGVGYPTKLSNSYSYGTVTGSGYKQGNLVGDADGSRIDKCYSSGRGKALIGYNFRSPVITNCYWDKDKGASSSSYGGSPRTTDQMTQRVTFVEWDFDDIWGIDEGQSYPYLRWEFEPTELLGILADDVIEFVQHEGIENSLLVKVDTALEKLLDENEQNDVAAINSLQAFINAVEAQRGNKISEEDADDLIASAQQIIDLLSSE